jgi:hypothetical protein
VSVSVPSRSLSYRAFLNTGWQATILLRSPGPKLTSKPPTYTGYYIHGPREPCAIFVIRSSIWPLGTLRKPNVDDLVHIPQRAEKRFSRKLGRKGRVVERIVNRGAKYNQIIESINRGKKPVVSCYHVLLLRGRAIRHSRNFLSWSNQKFSIVQRKRFDSQH